MDIDNSDLMFIAYKTKESILAKYQNQKSEDCRNIIDLCNSIVRGASLEEINMMKQQNMNSNSSLTSMSSISSLHISNSDTLIDFTKFCTTSLKLIYSAIKFNILVFSSKTGEMVSALTLLNLFRLKRRNIWCDLMQMAKDNSTKDQKIDPNFIDFFNNFVNRMNTLDNIIGTLSGLLNNNVVRSDIPLFYYFIVDNQKMESEKAKGNPKLDVLRNIQIINSYE